MPGTKYFSHFVSFGYIFLGQCVVWPWFSHSGYMEEQKPLKKGILFEKQDSLASDNTSKLNISLGFPQHTVIASSAYYVHLPVILIYKPRARFAVHQGKSMEVSVPVLLEVLWGPKVYLWFFSSNC